MVTQPEPGQISECAVCQMPVVARRALGYDPANYYCPKDYALAWHNHILNTGRR